MLTFDQFLEANLPELQRLIFKSNCCLLGQDEKNRPGVIERLSKYCASSLGGKSVAPEIREQIRASLEEGFKKQKDEKFLFLLKNYVEQTKKIQTKTFTECTLDIIHVIKEFDGQNNYLPRKMRSDTLVSRKSHTVKEKSDKEILESAKIENKDPAKIPSDIKAFIKKNNAIKELLEWARQRDQQEKQAVTAKNQQDSWRFFVINVLKTLGAYYTLRKIYPHLYDEVFVIQKKISRYSIATGMLFTFLALLLIFFLPVLFFTIKSLRKRDATTVLGIKDQQNAGARGVAAMMQNMFNLKIRTFNGVISINISINDEITSVILPITKPENSVKKDSNNKDQPSITPNLGDFFFPNYDDYSLLKLKPRKNVKMLVVEEIEEALSSTPQNQPPALPITRTIEYETDNEIIDRKVGHFTFIFDKRLKTKIPQEKIKTYVNAFKLKEIGLKGDCFRLFQKDKGPKQMELKVHRFKERLLGVETHEGSNIFHFGGYGKGLHPKKSL